MSKQLSLPLSASTKTLVSDVKPAYTPGAVKTGESSLLEILEQVDRLMERLSAGQIPLGQALEQLLDLMLTISGASSAIYFASEAEQEEMVIACSRGEVESQHLLGLRLKRQAVFLSPNATWDGAAVAGELYTDPYWLSATNPQEAARIHNLFTLIVGSSQHPIGLIHLYNFQTGDRSLLEMLAARLAHELDLMGRLQASQSSNQRLHRLIDAIGHLAGILDRKHLLRRITEHASQLVAAERSSIFIVDPASQETLYHVTYQAPAAADSTSTPIPAAGLRKTKPASSTPVANNLSAAYSDDSIKFLTSSTITIPLTAAGNEGKPAHTLGGLMVLNPRQGPFASEDAQLLEILAEQASSLLQVAELYETSEELFMNVIQALVAAVDAKDPATQGHSSRVSEYSVLIGNSLGLSPSQINDLRISSLLHDLGKIGIPDSILNKQDTLSAKERQVINSHPLIGAAILNQVKLLSTIVPGIIEHHERLDGSGYPYGLRGEKISIMGRIIMVADVFDAMTSFRPYRPAMRLAEALEYLHSHAGTQFDPECVHALAYVISSKNVSTNPRL